MYDVCLSCYRHSNVAGGRQGAQVRQPGQQQPPQPHGAARARAEQRRQVRRPLSLCACPPLEHPSPLTSTHSQTFFPIFLSPSASRPTPSLTLLLALSSPSCAHGSSSQAHRGDGAARALSCQRRPHTAHLERQGPARLPPDSPALGQMHGRRIVCIQLSLASPLLIQARQPPQLCPFVCVRQVFHQPFMVGWPRPPRPGLSVVILCGTLTCSASIQQTHCSSKAGTPCCSPESQVGLSLILCAELTQVCRSRWKLGRVITP